MKKTAVTFLCLAAILAHAAYVRRLAPWMPHWKGDQNHYVALAMKLEKFGLGGYNLRGVRFLTAIAGEKPKVIFTRATAADSPDETGDLVGVLKRVGQGYYDEPLHMRAPLFPWLVSVANALWSKPGYEYALVSSNPGRDALRVRPAISQQVQRWAVILSLMGNFLVLLLVFAAARMWFGDRVALYATFLLATNPIHITLGYRLLADDWVVVWLMGAMIAAYRAVTARDGAGFFAAGALLGLAFLTKQSVVVVAAGIFVFTALASDRSFAWRGLGLFLAGLLSVGSFWLIKVWQVYGHPLHQPPRELMIRSIHEDVTGWFRSLYAQMHPVFLFSVGLLYLSPLLVSAYATLARLKNAGNDRRWIYLWIWVLSFYIHFAAPWELLHFNGNREQRYFYPAYPAIVILAACGLDTLREKIGLITRRPWLAEAGIVLLLALNACWSIQIAMQKVFANDLFL